MTSRASHPATRPLSGALLDLLHDWGVRHLITCPGSTEAAVLDQFVDRDDLRLILTTHEGVTVSMADGLARATGRPAVAYLHANVGLTNGLANLYAAQIAHSPLVVLNGLKPSSVQSRGGFTTARSTRALVSQFVKDDWQSLAAAQVLEDVNRAFVTATAEPAGPVWVGLAQDLIEQDTDAEQPSVPGYRYDSRTRPPRTSLRRAAGVLASARHPVLVAGSEVGRADGIKALAALAERLGAPVLMDERRGFERTAFDVDHPHYRGTYRHDHPLVRDADVLFFAGARVFNEFEPTTRPPIPAGTRVIHSHPDPTRIAHTYPVEVGLVGDQLLVLEELCELLPPSSRPPLEPLDREPVLPDGREPSGPHLRPVDAAAVVTEALEGWTLVGDATTAGGVLAEQVRHHAADDYFVSTSGSLGWGMGAALGVALGSPGRRVAAVLGDGVFQFGVASLWTAAHYRIPVAFVVFNNQRYAAVGAALRRHRGRALQTGAFPGTDLSGPHLAEVSSGFGVPGRRVETLADLRDAVDALTRAEGPVLLEVMTDPDDFGP